MLYYKKGGDKMNYIYILAIIFFVLGYILKIMNNKNNSTNKMLIISCPMTTTELNFYKILEEILNKYEFKIIPQIQLQKIFQADNITDFNKIKSKSIDYAVVDKEFKYKFFIELDDYTHNFNKRVKRDTYINELFKEYNLKLIRIKANNHYDLSSIEEKIKECI